MKHAIAILFVFTSLQARSQAANDWEEMGLKGSPKSVSIVHDRDINMCKPLTEGSLTYVFDENGYEAKRLYAWRYERKDSVGKPYSFFDTVRIANTFANGCRVAKVIYARSGDMHDTISYVYNGQKLMIRKIGKEHDGRESLFDPDYFRYEYEYDGERRLSMELRYDPKGRLLDTVRYRYSNGRLVEKAIIEPGFGLWQVCSYKYDTCGLIVEEIHDWYSRGEELPQIKRKTTVVKAYAYPSKDKFGNWLERNTDVNKAPGHYEKREIVYFSSK
jgi:hypothetical protein